MKISVIIPALNEAAALPATLAALATQEGAYEIILCDGSSTDGTLDLARDAGAIIITTARGRGQQLRAGAARATGDVLLFLHADTVLAQGAFDAVREALADPAIGGGNFRVVFDGETDFAAWLTRFYGWFRGHGLYYGDSAIFVRRTVYDAIGGVRPLALMEDYDLVRRLERGSRTVCIDDPPVVTSSRRFDSRKPWRIFTQWLVIHALYYARVRPALLARLYRSASHHPADGRP